MRIQINHLEDCNCELDGNMYTCVECGLTTPDCRISKNDNLGEVVCDLCDVVPNKLEHKWVKVFKTMSKNVCFGCNVESFSLHEKLIYLIKKNTSNLMEVTIHKVMFCNMCIIEEYTIVKKEKYEYIFIKEKDVK